MSPANIALFVISALVSAYGIWMIVNTFRDWTHARQHNSDSQAIHARAKEIVAEFRQEDPRQYPQELPPALANHRHRWDQFHTCICGAHRGQDGTVRIWTRGQTVLLGGTRRPILFVNVTHCWHYVVQTGPSPEEYKHYTAGELAAIIQHLDVTT